MAERFLSRAELGRFLLAVRMSDRKQRARDYALFVLLSSIGVRPSEALALTGSDIHHDCDPPWVRVLRLKKKRESADELIVPPEVAVTLKQFMEQAHIGPSDRIFVLSRRQAERIFHYYARAAKIRRRISLYILRHTAATRIYQATRDIKVVQSVLGHESADTSCIYAHVSMEMQREHVDRFPAII